ncbi:MAG: triple tyrosine motif-containing protein [Flavobacteriaceae bacterium]
MMVLGQSHDLQSQEISPIQIFSPQQTASGNQNWMISQGEDQAFYFANNQGLLSYNGAQWKLHPAKDNSIIRAVKVIKDRIYSSSYRDFGYWEKDPSGTLIYTSLSEQLSFEILEDEQFWNIFSYQDKVVFQSLNRLIILDPSKNKVNSIQANNTLLTSFVIDDILYFQVQNEGLYQGIGNSIVLQSNEPIFKKQRLAGLVKKEDALIVFTQDQGLYLWKNNRLVPWEEPNRLLQNYTLYTTLKLKKGYALGTVGKGLLLLSEEGEVEQALTQEKGLSNNTILSLFEDKEANLWLGLDNGINLINRSSAFKEYIDVTGQLGSIYTSTLHQGYLYLGTNQGLFVKKRLSDEAFELIPGTQGQVWNLTIIDGALFCGHNKGAFVIDEKKAKLISTVMGTWLFKQHPTQANIIFMGNYTGLYLLEKKGSSWMFRNKIEGFDISSRFFEFITPTQLVINHEYKGVYTITIDNALMQASSIEIEEASCFSCNSSLVHFDQNIYYQAKKELFKYTPEIEGFVIDTLLTQLMTAKDFVNGKLLNDSFGDLWLFSREKIFLIKKSKEEIKIKSIALNENDRKNVSGFEHINPLENNTYFIGTNKGYLTVNIELDKYNENRVEITSITSDDKSNFKRLSLIDETKLPSQMNNLAFTFTGFDFNRYGKTKFQYKLEGEDEDWSLWTNDTAASYANLAAGSYRLLLRSMRGEEFSEIVSSPVIRIHPPWYFNRIAISIYAIILTLLLIGYNAFYKRKLTRQRQQLEKENKRLLEIQDLEAQKEIIRLRNEQLKKDIDGKSRELAVATMSTLKRNEFLTTIKAELETIKGESKAEKLIKKINAKLKSNDDWEYFKKAFDNTDQPLFSKLKETHPTLTKNDLKLCAYLRLNLSSKEIAPLLNISVHSVEIKRYRLRKKMGLERSQGIVEYIMTF